MPCPSSSVPIQPGTAGSRTFSGSLPPSKPNQALMGGAHRWLPALPAASVPAPPRALQPGFASSHPLLLWAPLQPIQTTTLTPPSTPPPRGVPPPPPTRGLTARTHQATCSVGWRHRLRLARVITLPADLGPAPGRDCGPSFQERWGGWSPQN